MPLFFLLVLLTAPLWPQQAVAESVGFTLELSDRFTTGDDYMEIRLLGALSLMGRDELAEMSDLAWDEDEGILYGVTDRGLLLHLRPLLVNGRLVDVELLHHVRLQDKRGKKLKKPARDAEGLALEGSRNGIRGDSRLAVSFEGDHRVDIYSPEGVYLRPLNLPAELRDERLYKHGNKGLEALARHPVFGYMTGPEMAKGGGTIPIFGESGMSWRYQPFEPDGALVALEALDDGTLLILERAYSSVFEPLVITLSSALPTRENADSVLDARRLARFDSTRGWQTQNFEGLTHHQGRRFFMVSDDGGKGYLQTQLLYLETR